MSKHINSRRGISRRDFARQAALAATTAAVLPATLFSEPTGVSAAPAPAAPQQAPTQPPKLSPESQAEVEAKVQAILHRYGSHLTEEQKKDVRRLVTEFQAPLEKLRSFPLENGDGPATLFVPSREPSPAGGQSQRSPKTVRRPKLPVQQKGSR